MAKFKTLNDQERDEFGNTVAWLQANHGYTWQQISVAAGLPGAVARKAFDANWKTVDTQHLTSLRKHVKDLRRMAAKAQDLERHEVEEMVAQVADKLTLEGKVNQLREKWGETAKPVKGHDEVEAGDTEVEDQNEIPPAAPEQAGPADPETMTPEARRAEFEELAAKLQAAPYGYNTSALADAIDRNRPPHETENVTAKALRLLREVWAAQEGCVVVPAFPRETAIRVLSEIETRELYAIATYMHVTNGMTWREISELVGLTDLRRNLTNNMKSQLFALTALRDWAKKQGLERENIVRWYISGGEIKLLKEVEKKHTAKLRGRPKGAELKPSEAKEVASAIEAFRAAGWTLRQIADAMGYSEKTSPSVVSTALKQNGAVRRVTYDATMRSYRAFLATSQANGKHPASVEPKPEAYVSPAQAKAPEPAPAPEHAPAPVLPSSATTLIYHKAEVALEEVTSIEHQIELLTDQLKVVKTRYEKLMAAIEILEEVEKGEL